jgi:hypothetical protein
MDPNAQRGRGDRTPGADAYWQRRFFTLVGGLAVIGLLVWAVSGVASGGKSSKSSSGGPSSAAYANTATGSPTPSAPVTSAPASPSPSVSPSASPSATATASPKATAAGKASAKAAAGPVACPAADVVLTVTASQASYGAKDTPTFQVDIVSTNAATCTLATGPENLKLVILHGGTTAYNSAACVRGAPEHVISLRRGVPVVTSMTWNKQQQTASGCGSTVPAAANRTYSAVAQAGGAQSPGASFRLTAPAATSTAKAAAKPAA